MRHDAFYRGMLAGILLMLGAQAIQWFITPASHPHAGTARTLAVALQAAIGFGGALWLQITRSSATSATAD